MNSYYLEYDHFMALAVVVTTEEGILNFQSRPPKNSTATTAEVITTVLNADFGCFFGSSSFFITYTLTLGHSFDFFSSMLP